MFIASSTDLCRGPWLNSPAGATMVPAVPLSPLTIRKIPLARRQSRAGRKMQLRRCLQPRVPSHAVDIRRSACGLSPICALSAALVSLPPRRRSSVNSSEVVLDRGCAPQAAQRTPRSAIASRAAESAHQRHRVERASSPTADHWQVLQPIFGVIIGDDCTFAAFSSTQPPFFDFRVGGRPAYFVAFAKLLDTHRPLQGAALTLSL